MAVIRWITIVVMLMWMLVIEIPIALSFSLALSDAAAKYTATSLLRIVARPLWIRYTHLESVLCFSLSLDFFALSSYQLSSLTVFLSRRRLNIF